MGCFSFQTMVTGERREVGSVCNSHRQVPANKARSVLPQVQRRGGGGGREGGREGGRKRRESAAP